MRTAFLGSIVIGISLLLTVQILLQTSPGWMIRGFQIQKISDANKRSEVVDSRLDEGSLTTSTESSLTTSILPPPPSPPKKSQIQHTPKTNSFAQTYWNLTFTQVADNFAQNFQPIKYQDSELIGNLSDLKSSLHNACAVLHTDGESIDDCVLDTLMKRRQIILRNGCGELYNNTKLPKLNTYDYYVLKSRRLVWCPVFKASSSNWMENFVMMADEPIYKIESYRKNKKYDQLNTLTRRIAPQMSESTLTKFINTDPKPVKFIIVRDPLERMISAYRDKLEKMMPYYYKTYGSKIVNRYRKEGLKRFGNDYYKEISQLVFSQNHLLCSIQIIDSNSNIL